MGLFRNKQGDVVDVPDDQASHALDLGFAPVASGEAAGELTKEDRDEGGVGGAIKAGLSSALSGATLGGSDWLAKGFLSAGHVKDIAAAREDHPYVSAGANIVGAAVPGLVAPESLLGRTPAGYLARMTGEAAEAARVTGGLRGLAGTVAATGLEGAAQNAGMYLSDVALGNRDLSAEGLASAAGLGFGLGGLPGGAIYGIDQGTMAARRMFSRSLDDASDATRSWERTSSEMLDAHDQTAVAAQQRLKEIAAERAELQRGKALAGSDLAQAKLDLANAPPNMNIPEFDSTKLAPDRVSVAPDQITQAKLKLTQGVGAASADEAAAAGAQAGRTQADAEIMRSVGGSDAPTALEQQLQQMKSQLDAGATLQDLRLRPPQSEAALVQEEQSIRTALDDYGTRRAKVNDWIARLKNPRTTFEHDAAAEVEGGLSPLVRGKTTRALDEDVFVEQSGGQLKTIGKGEHTLEDITPNSRILARSNADKFSRGAVLDEAYQDAIERASLAETPALKDAALHEAADIEQQIHTYVREAKPENAAVIDQIGKVRAENGRTGYHAAQARADKLAENRAAAVPSKFGRSAEEAGTRSTNIGGAAETRAELPAKRSIVEDAHEAAGVLGEYEKSAAKLTEALGDRAAPAAKEAAAGFRAAEDTATRKQVERTTRAVDDHVSKTPAERIEAAKKSRLEADVKLSKLKAEEIELRGKVKEAPGKGKATLERKPAAPPAPKSKLAKFAAGVEKAGEIAEMAGMAGIPGIPKPSDIPVVGPLLGAFLKFRALTGKLVGRVPATGEVKAATLAAQTQQKMLRSIDRALGTAERAIPVARQVSVAASTVLGERVFDDGQRNSPANASPRELCADRVREITAAAANPQAILAQVRAEMHDVSDPDLIAAAEQFRLRQLSYLNSVAPKTMTADPLSGVKPLPPSAAEAKQFSQQMAVAADPTVAADAVHTGELTPSMVQTAWAVHPQTMLKGQAKLMKMMGSPKIKTSYNTRLRLQMLYRVPLDGLSDPATMHLLQPASATKSPAAPTQAPPVPSTAGPVDLGKLYQTPSDRRAARS